MNRICLCVCTCARRYACADLFMYRVWMRVYVSTTPNDDRYEQKDE